MAESSSLQYESNEVTPLTLTLTVSERDAVFGSASQDEEEDSKERNDSTLSLSDHNGTIGILGSISIAVNSLIGPAMLNLPSVFQKSGIIPTTFTIAFLCILSTLCSLHMANTISKVPGNAHFHKEIEYSEAFRHFWGHSSFVFTQFAFFACITCLNIASIVDTAQVVDQMLSRLGDGTAAFEWRQGGWELIRWAAHTCSGERIKDGNCVPFEANESNSYWMITAGYLVAMVIFLPMSLKDLKENTIFQIIGFLVLIVLSCQFIVSFYLHGFDCSNVNLWGTDWSDMFGVILFNFAVVMAVPAWLYERRPDVSVTTSLNNSSIIGFLLYISVGGLGALTMPNVADNMLQSMMAGAFGQATETCSMVFAFFIIGLGIPLFSVLTRLNLSGSELCTEFQANILAVYLPWSTAWLLYSGGKTTALLGWGGIFFTSIIVFIAPLVLALHTINNSDNKGSIKVYGRFFQGKTGQIVSLSALMFFSTVSIILAFIGKFR